MRIKSVDKMLRALIDTRQALTATAYTYCFGSISARQAWGTRQGLGCLRPPPHTLSRPEPVFWLDQPLYFLLWL